MKRLKRFVIVGAITVAIDYLTYYILVTNFGNSYYFKGISFATGATFSYICNSLFSFEQKRLSRRQLTKFMAVYIISLLVNVHVNSVILNMNWHNLQNISLYVSFVVATLTSTMLNFTLMNFYVFK